MKSQRMNCQSKFCSKLYKHILPSCYHRFHHYRLLNDPHQHSSIAVVSFDFHS